ncbi:MAG: ATPase [uncultured bacterium]|uniref:Polymerase III, delta'' subunit protein n=4 Tax=Candidatus Daviesiibacteriota TaxID=1752718 RepID=A0A0G0I371_9BACT|nr:MAG: ATPase [uncultured bacterium]KKQ10551.1 MAG: polymerase III, delta'' subunit protein [Candidatus Daviesbacteria bacterium GW2011_GWB1_36_5]KKQ15294.1 MAG: polymerase III, delta'' subunit protein [Candidatus Daviesbacteria bacterium GW2011_GWA1_36_8]OGE17188.1 MAG: hypothetical protein A2858_00595 [Candidatus Daviesbacteria bacterium RIFCSPHIGHO2_01_FULL_36_37]OGE35969.1 MAG: hypothetical protein A3E66_01590 [Candidatus Daviesbacteria bacterium RIFCSPHIGHO2_12_FULL_37_16]
MIARIFISPDLNIRQEEFLKILGEHDLKTDHPDVLYINNEERLGVEASKRVREHLSLKPYSTKGRGVFIESAQNFTPEAQNSLLKTLEEPPEEAVIILGVEKEDQLIPTILSRCEIVILNEVKDMNLYSSPAAQNDIEKLQKMTLEERFEFVEKTEDKEGFLRALTNYFRGEKLEDKKNLEFAKKLIEAEEWAGANVGIRGILEYLMLELPVGD